MFLLAAIADRWLHLSHRLRLRLMGRATVEDRLDEYGPTARERVRRGLAETDVSYPPARVLLLGLKAERRLDVFVASTSGDWRLAGSYPVLGSSGTLGPKLKEGDRQVPEGFYEIESLNPNSAFHLSLRLNYPSDEDIEHGREDARPTLGSDIMIHGNQVSIGCLAMGDPAIEKLFVLAADTGLSNIEVVLSPVDFRTSDMPSDYAPPYPWVSSLHRRIRERVRSLPTAR